MNSEMKNPEMPNEAVQHLERAYSYKEKDKFKDALREADAAIKFDSSLAEAHNLRGIALEELGNEPEAIKAYRQALVLNPNFREAKNNLADLEAGQHLEQARSYEESGKFEDMLREADAAVQIDSSLAEAHNLRAIALEELGNEVEAIKAYRQAIVLNPDSREIKNSLSDLEEYLIEQHQLKPNEKYTDPDAKYELVTIARFMNTVEADIAKSILDREGIWSFIDGGDFRNSWNPTIFYTRRLQVRQPDAERALELINEKPDGAKALKEELGKDKESQEPPIHQSPVIRHEKSNTLLSFFRKKNKSQV